MQEEILPQDKEAEELQIRALTRALSVRVRVLDVAGASAYARLYELRDAQDHPNSSASGSTVGVDGADPSAQVVHLLHTPGHYNLVYPAGQNILSPQVNIAVPSTQTITCLTAQYTEAADHRYTNARFPVMHFHGMYPYRDGPCIFSASQSMDQLT